MKKNYFIYLITFLLTVCGYWANGNESKAQNTLIHFWYFDGTIPNNTPLQALDATYSLTGENVKMEFQSALDGYPFDNTHPSWRKASMERRNSPIETNYRSIANGGLPYVSNDMRGIQIKQPFIGDAGENTLIFHLPTTGYQGPVFSFAALNEGAAEALIIDYTIQDAVHQWTEDGLQTTSFPLSDSYTLFTIDFSENGNNIVGADNNPHFKIRIRFKGENMETDLGDRVTFNNFSLDATPLEDTNRPPIITNPVTLQKLIAGSSATDIDLSQVFTDPDNDPLTFTASHSKPDFITAQIVENTLSLSALKPGDALITLTASDGENPYISLEFRVLIYPAAFDLSQDDFVFDTWNNNQPEYSYPPNMIFLQADKSDPELDYDLLYPYYIPHDDYHADDQESIGFPYNNVGRTRINGLGIGGVSFINTGRDRDLGGALVAINTLNQTDLHLGFLGGTLAKNERVYAFRLQYRIGTTGDFTDFLVNGFPVQYTAASDGDIIKYENITLPQGLLGREYVQLLWRYFLQSGETGPRSQLRLDDIVITRSTSIIDSELYDIKIYAAQKSVFVESAFDGNFTINIYNVTGQKVYSRQLGGQGQHQIQPDLTSGVYIVTYQSDQISFSRKVILQ